MEASVSSTEANEGPATPGFWALTLGSIGVVFGDIGTSPLYAFRQAVTDAAHGEPVTRAMVLGVLSLILWALLIVVTSKYVLLLLRADNAGEGGTLSLMALGPRALEHYVVPLTVGILLVLFSVQSRGTARVASAFGPVMVVWFATLAVLGIIHVADDPSVLAAINPLYAIEFLLSHGTIGLVTLGAVFLAVTGGEALYADLGHF